jgi:hypothetical protein
MHGTTNERTMSVSSSRCMHTVEILKTSKLAAKQQISGTREFATCVVFERGASRYVFTTDVSVDEVQAFIRHLVRVLGWFTPLGPYGR